jgi:hypothetical protein
MSNLPTQQSISEAASRPLEFNPKERANYIRKCLKDIHSCIAEKKSTEEIRSQFQAFAELYPELFKKIVGGHDLSPVQNMLVMLDSMGEGKLSQHQASVIVGKSLVDRYVTPQLQ